MKLINLFLIILLATVSMTHDLAGEQITVDTDPQVYINEDFSDYSNLTWIYSSETGKNFKSDANPATFSGGQFHYSSLYTDDNQISSLWSMTVYFRMKVNSTSEGRYAGFFIEGGSDQYFIGMSTQTGEKELLVYGGVDASYFEKRKYINWDVNTWHWFRVDIYEETTSTKMDVSVAINSTEVLDKTQLEYYPSLSITDGNNAWFFPTRIGFTAIHSSAPFGVTEWNFDDLILQDRWETRPDEGYIPPPPEPTVYFEEDFSNYATNAWSRTHVSGDRDFTANANPAMFSGAQNHDAYLSTNKLDLMQDRTNMTIYYRIKLSDNQTETRHGGLYFEIAGLKYWFGFGVDTYGTYFGHNIVSETRVILVGLNEDSWHWMRLDLRKAGSDWTVDISVAINRGVDLPTDFTFYEGMTVSLGYQLGTFTELGFNVYHSYLESTTSVWEFDDLKVEIIKDTLTPIKPYADYHPLNRTGYDVYQLLGAKGQTLNLHAKFLYDPIEIAIMDTNYNNTVGNDLRYGLIFPMIAPHLLEMSSGSWVGNEPRELSLTVPADEIYIVIFSSVYITLGIELDHEIYYKLTSDIELTEVGASRDKSILMPHSSTGTITDNADPNWDDGEWVIYSAGTLATGTLFDMQLDSDGSLTYILFEGTTLDDMNKAWANILSGGDLAGIHLYDFSRGETKYVSFRLESSHEMNIAIFMQGHESSSSSDFKLTSSVPLSLLDESGEVTTDDDDTVSGPIPFWFSAIILPVVTIIYKKRK